MKKILIIAFIVMSTTLQAYYFRSIGFAPMPLIGFATLTMYTPLKNIKSSEWIFFICTYAIILISTLVGFFNLKYNIFSSFYFPTFIGWLITPFAIIFFKRLYENTEKEILIKAVSIVLIVHVFFFAIQYIYYQVTGVTLDFLVSITGEVSRVDSGKLQEFRGSLIRSSGLFSEPGSYSVYIYILVAILFELKQKMTLLIICALATMFLSFSMTGILMAIFFYLYYLSQVKFSFKSVRNVIFALSGFVLIIYFQKNVFLGPMLDRINGLNGDASAEARFVGSYEAFIRDGYSISGIGIGLQIEDMKATSVLVGGLFDLGFVLLTFLMIIKLFFVLKNNWVNKLRILIILPVLASNISLNQIIYCMILGFLFINLSHKLNNIKSV